MKNTLTGMFVMFAIAMLLIISGTLYAQDPGTLTANASAEITEPLTIEDNSGISGGTTLNFGQMTISSSEGGTCILSTTNSRSATGGVTVVSASASTNASFGISGKKGASYAITLPSSGMTLTLEGGEGTMTVGSFTARPVSGGADQFTGTLDASTGKDSFTVGGTLTVNAAQKAGIYNGTFAVSIAYN